MRRVVVTGMGICSPIGNDLATVAHSLRHGISGIGESQELKEHGFSALYKGEVKNLRLPEYSKDDLRIMGVGNVLRFTDYATIRAVEDSGLMPDDLRGGGVIYGQGGGSTIDIHMIAAKTLERGRPYPATPKTINGVFPTMASGASAWVGIKHPLTAISLGVSAACATGNFATGLGARMVRDNDAPLMIVGGVDSTDWVMCAPFQSITAMSTNRHKLLPQQISRPFDIHRDGFVVGEGAGTLVLEELGHAKARGAKIYCEVVGFGFSADGTGEPTDPDVGGAARSMMKALDGLHGQAIDLRRVAYVKAHGTSTPVGDVNELKAIETVFGASGHMPRIGSTKSLTGHALGGAGALESIFSILMLKESFMAPSINIDEPDPIVAELGLDDALLREGVADIEMDVVVANSFGFGGTNSTLAFARYDG